MSNKPLFPDVLDTQFVFSFNPESILDYPLGYRFLVRNVDTGELITPDENDLTIQHWNEILVEEAATPDSGRLVSPLTPESSLSSTIEIPLLLERANKKGGVFLLMAYVYDESSGKLLEREQSQYMIIIENGLKPPSLH